jgi:hypothetical protein
MSYRDTNKVGFIIFRSFESKLEKEFIRFLISNKIVLPRINLKIIPRTIVTIVPLKINQTGDMENNETNICELHKNKFFYLYLS